MRAALLSIVVWSALAFGAVYPWAYVPVLLVCVFLALATRPRSALSREERRLGLALGAVAVAIGLQLLPMPRPILGRLSPGTDAALLRLDLAYATVVLQDPRGAAHPLSLSPHDTAVAVAFLVALVALWAVAASLLASEGARHLSRGIAASGVLLAVIGIVQRAVADLPYGFWNSQEGGKPFGPFINRNHFAGWMIMALPVAIGGLSATLSSVEFPDRARWRERVLWLGSPQGGEVVLFGISILVMAAGLALTYSKSGVAGLCWVSAAMAVIAWRGQRTARRGFLLMTTVSALVLALLVWAGLDVIAARFGAMPASRLAGRLDAWRDAWDLWRLFPVTGVGVNAYGHAMLLHQQRDLAFHYLEAHNDYLQLLAEGGLLVALPASVAVCLFIQLAGQRVRAAADTRSGQWLRTGALAGIAAVAFQELFDFSLQVPADAVLFTLLMAIATHRVSRPDRHTASVRRSHAEAVLSRHGGVRPVAVAVPGVDRHRHRHQVR